MDIKPINVPFDESGNQLHREWGYGKDFDMLSYVEPFMAKMTFEQIHHFSSGAVTFRNQAGLQFWMSKAIFEQNIKHMVKGVLEGMFFFRKQGKYYSLVYIPDADA